MKISPVTTNPTVESISVKQQTNTSGKSALLHLKKENVSKLIKDLHESEESEHKTQVTLEQKLEQEANTFEQQYNLLQTFFT